MKPPPFSYHAPSTVAEALDLLGRYEGDAKLVAGGQSLLPLLNFRLSRPAALVDISRFTTSLGSDEMVTAVRFPTREPGSGSAFRELGRRSGDRAMVAVATVLALDDTGAVRWVRIALGGIDQVPVRAAGAEVFLVGKRPGWLPGRSTLTATCTPPPTTGGSWRPS